jgi:hypothetical protein
LQLKEEEFGSIEGTRQFFGKFGWPLPFLCVFSLLHENACNRFFSADKFPSAADVAKPDRPTTPSSFFSKFQQHLTLGNLATIPLRQSKKRKVCPASLTFHNPPLRPSNARHQKVKLDSTLEDRGQQQ